MSLFQIHLKPESVARIAMIKTVLRPAGQSVRSGL